MYLRELVGTDRSLARQVRELYDLIRHYGPDAVSAAMHKAHAACAIGADCIANILHQQQTLRELRPPVRLPSLN